MLTNEYTHSTDGVTATGKYSRRVGGVAFYKHDSVDTTASGKGHFSGSMEEKRRGGNSASLADLYPTPEARALVTRVGSTPPPRGSAFIPMSTWS